MTALRKTALCLVGGGAKGIITCGALKYIHEKKIQVDAIFSASSGALNAAVYAGGDIELLEHLWMNIRNKDVRTLAPWKLLLGNSFYDSSPLFKTIQKYVDPVKLRASQIPIIITVTDTHESRPFRIQLNNPGNYDIHKMLLASASIPIAFPCVDGRFYDGGVMDDYNLGRALDCWFQDIIMVHPSRPGPIKVKTVHDAIDVLMGNLGWANYLAMKARAEHTPGFIVREIIPLCSSKISTLDFDYKGFDRAALIQSGYDLARASYES